MHLGGRLVEVALLPVMFLTAGSLNAFAQEPTMPAPASLIGFMSPSAHPFAFEAETSAQDPQTGPSRGASNAQQSGLVSRSVKRVLHDQGQLYAAPFKPSNLKWDALFLIGTGGLIAADRHIRKALPDTHLDTYHAIANASIASLSVASGGIFIYGRKQGHEHAKEAGNLELEALVNTFLVYAPMQLLAGRERPDEGTGNGRFWKHNRFESSFPGGHSMFSYAMATVISHEYPKPWVEFLTYGAATTVTAGRLLGRNHFTSDLFVGSILGYLIGTHIFHSHCKIGLSPSCHNDNSALLAPDDSPYELSSN